MGFGIVTTTDPKHVKKIDAIINNINQSSLDKNGLVLSFEKNKLEFYFSGGYNNHTYYSLCYLMQEIAFHYGFVEGTSLTLIHNDQGLIVVTKEGESFNFSKSNESAVIKWINEYLEPISSLDEIEIDFVQPISRTKHSFFSGKRRYKNTALKMFKPE